MAKHKGREQHASNKKLHKPKAIPDGELLESQAPQVPKAGTNAKNQYR